jgi:signal transduction histidine kinase
MTSLLRALPLAWRGPLFNSAVVLLALAIFSTVGAMSIHRTASNANQLVIQTAGVVADRVDGFFERTRADVRRLATWPSLAAVLERLQSDSASVLPVWRSLHDLVISTNTFKTVMVIGRDGTVHWVEPPGLGFLGANLLRYPQVQKAMLQRDVYVSDLINDTRGLEPEPHVLVGAPISNAGGDLVGIVLGVLNLDALGRQLQVDEDRQLDTRLYLFDRANHAVIDVDPYERIGDEEEESEQVEAALGTGAVSDAGIVQASHDRFVVVRPLAAVPWNVAMSTARTAIGEEVTNVLLRFAAIGALLGGLILLLTVPFVGSVVRPLGVLAGEAQRIADGDFNQEIPTDGRDEVTTLALSLDHMRKQLLESRNRWRNTVSELAEIGRVKDEFIGSLSHELRTPMHVVRGYIDILLDGGAGELSEAVRDMLLAARRNHDILWELISKCLDLGRIDDGRETAYPEAFDLCVLVRDVMAEFTSVISARGLRGSTCLPEAGCQVTSDRAKVKCILRNLIGNAVKFTDRGEVGVALHDAPDPAAVTIAIRDTGIGMRPEDQQVVFERFRKLGDSPAQSKGLGLGLSLSIELAKLLNGHISVTSTFGVGSTFSFTIPRTISGAPATVGKHWSVTAPDTQTGKDPTRRDDTMPRATAVG